MTDVVALAAELVAIQSSTGSEGAVVEFVSRWLIARGWNVELQEVTRGRANVWARRKGHGVTLSTHLDTVVPHVPPREMKGRLYGRGACDAKGIAAAMMVAADRLAKSGEERVDLLLLVGEEAGSDGARQANRLSPTSKHLVNGEPTESKLASGAKGSLRAILRFRGRAAHSAYPELGKSAVTPMLKLLSSIDKLKLPTDKTLGKSTVNIGTIRAGTAGNIVPDLAESELMFRLVGDVSKVKKALEKWVGKKADIEYGSHIPAQKFETIPGFAITPVSYTTDIPLLTRWGRPLLFGPGSIHVAHTAEEYIDIGELRSAVDAYERIVRTLLKS
jgi:acetylornithine deacetylase